VNIHVFNLFLHLIGYLIRLSTQYFAAIYASWNGGGSYPVLSGPSLFKLKQLSVVTLAGTSRILPYELLQSELDLPEVRQLEDLLMECLYSGLISGHLNQKEHRLELTNSMSRDVSKESVDSMLATIDNWLLSTETVIKQLDIMEKKASTDMLTNYNLNKENSTNIKKSVELVRDSVTKESGDGHRTSLPSSNKRMAGRSHPRAPNTAMAGVGTGGMMGGMMGGMISGLMPSSSVGYRLGGSGGRNA
jgi:hypothetical protein